MTLVLPDDLDFARWTPTFDETSVPAGLLAANRAADGVWGRLVVESGAIGFVFEDAAESVRRLVATWTNATRAAATWANPDPSSSSKTTASTPPPP